MDWRPYNECCHRRALDRDAAVCPDCGHPLLRCHGFEECHTLVEPLGHCPVHVAPKLFLQQDALPAPKVGDRLSLPLVLENTTTLGRALKVMQVYRQRGDGGYEEVDLQWEKLPPGRERRFSVDTDALESGGYQLTRLMLVLGVLFAELEERYAFSAEIGLRIAHQESNQIVQNIHVEGGRYEPGASAVLQTGPSVSSGFAGLDNANLAAGRSEIALDRAERFEIKTGLRGYRSAGVAVPRTVEVVCEGFPEGDVMPQRKPFLAQARIGCGRSSTRYDAEQNPHPNFLCQRAYDPRSGQLQMELSRRISRRHFELAVMNGRLVLCNRGRTGTVNGQTLENGETRVLEDGDVFNPLGLDMRFLDTGVHFAVGDGVVERIRLRRQG